MSSIAQQDVITNADRDLNDNLLHVRFSYAAVLNDPEHSPAQQPFFFVRLRNITKSTTLYEDFTYSNQPGKTFLIGTGGYKYTAFSNVDIVVPDADLGDTLEIQALASDCSPTAHAGYVYLDGFGSAVVGTAHRSGRRADPLRVGADPAVARPRWRRDVVDARPLAAEARLIRLHPRPRKGPLRRAFCITAPSLRPWIA